MRIDCIIKKRRKNIMKFYSNEIVFRGHPDKVCDQISAAILAECMRQDPNTRAGIEVAGGKGIIFITGEVTTSAKYSAKKIAKRVLKDVGYSTKYKIIDNIGRQSKDIELGTNDEIGGAGDQGMMYGYACDDNEKHLPTAMVILQELAEWYDIARKEHPTVLYPDGKAQITGRYDDEGKLEAIETFTISYQNSETNRKETDAIIKEMAENICDKYGVKVDAFLINPTGKFSIGGFEGDAGVTGRKIVVDAYQGFAKVGGGNMNGKDPSKVDFSAAHKAREIAVRILEERKLKWCEVQLSFAIGIDRPLAIYINSDKGEITPTRSIFNECTPKRIIEDLKLKQADFEELAKFGHFRG